MTTTANSTTTPEMTAANPKTASEMIDEMVAEHHFLLTGAHSHSRRNEGPCRGNQEGA